MGAAPLVQVNHGNSVCGGKCGFDTKAQSVMNLYGQEIFAVVLVLLISLLAKLPQIKITAKCGFMTLGHTIKCPEFSICEH